MRSSLAERIHRAGPVPFSVFVDAALYDPATGFFARGRGAGRAGADFVTSPEVGPLFGACVARAFDAWWEAMGAPDPFVVVEAGAGTGRLCREVLRAEPECAPALRYVMVERSDELRDRQRDRLVVEPFEFALGPSAPVGEGEPAELVARTGPIVSALDELPAVPFEGVVLANELLDNLPFDLVERTEHGWAEVRVGVDEAGRFHEVVLPASEELEAWMTGIDVPTGTRLPAQRQVEEWIDAAASVLRRGVIVCIDYAADAATMAARGRGWLRTFREHGRGRDPLEAPGSQDLTADVLLEPARRAARQAGLVLAAETTQAEWLAGLGIDALVEEGAAIWRAGAARGDLEAIAGRSRATEAAALTDPGGLGGHTVLVCTKAL